MATTFENAKISAYGDRVQILGLASAFDTQALLNADLAVLNLRKQPLETNLSTQKESLSSWSAFKTSLTNFNTISKNLSSIATADKQATSSSTVITAKAKSNAANSEYSIDVHSLATKHRIASDKFEGATLPSNETVQINNVDFVVTDNMTLNDFAKIINDNADANVNAVVLDGRLVMTSKTTGAENEIQLSNSALFDTLGLTSSGAIKNELQVAKDSSFTINGVALTSSTNSYNEIEGLEISFTGVTSIPADLTVERNADTVIDATKEFINAYNQMIGNLNFMNGEGGDMQGESLLRSLKQKMSSALTSTIFGGNTLSAIGIKLTTNNNATIELDESKLREAYNNDPSLINELLNGQNGFATKITNLNESYINDEKGLIKGKIDSINTRIKNITTSIEKYDLQFEQQQKILLTKYASYETAQSTLNTKLSSVKAILGIEDDDD